MSEEMVKMQDGAIIFTRLLGCSTGRSPIIALHGSPGIDSHADAEAAWSFLADRYQVLVFDARGSGVSDSQSPLSHAQWVSDVDELRIFFGWKRIVLAAHSYGGYIALDYAVKCVERVSALMLVSASGSCANNQAWANAFVAAAHLEIDRDRLARLVNGRVWDNDDLWSAVNEYSSLWRPAQVPAREYARRPANLKFKTHNSAFSRECPNHDIRAELPGLACPTLICAGTGDPRVQFSQLLARQIPLAELVQFECSAHAPPLEEPTLFRATVRDFLDRTL